MSCKALLTKWLLVGLLSWNVVYAANNEQDEVWMVTQEMIKFGKKETYEGLKSSMLEKWNIVKKRGDIGMMVGLEELDEPHYLYLTPIKDYAGLDRFMNLHRQVMNSWTPDETKMFTTGFDSTLNLKIRTLMRYRHSCSYVPDDNCHIRNLSYVHYVILTMVPGSGQHLERRLEELVSKQTSQGTAFCWRTWEITFGGEVPQFVVAFFGVDPVTLNEKVERLGLINSTMKDIVLREKKGTARYRPDLSVME